MLQGEVRLNQCRLVVNHNLRQVQLIGQGQEEQQLDKALTSLQNSQD